MVPSCKIERSPALRQASSAGDAMSWIEGSVEPGPNPSPSLFDPDLDIPRQAQSQLSGESIDDQRRLIVNPFLAVLGWLIVLVIIRISLRSLNSLMFLTGLGLLWVPVFLFQYHCLDCGATGWLQTFRRHCCPAVTARAQNGVAPRFPGFSVKSQVIGWIYFLVAAFVVIIIVLAARG
jgi:hypothetical protein